MREERPPAAARADPPTAAHAGLDLRAEAEAWAARAPSVPESWFARLSRLHGVRHTQRVHVHAQRLAADIGWGDADTRLVLRAALWHDIGRTNDDDHPGHGSASAARAEALGLTAQLSRSEASIVLFAVTFHSRADAAALRSPRGLPRAEAKRALRVLWLLKDADALDRVRLTPGEAADPRFLRHPETVAMLPFADALYGVLAP